MHKFLIIYVAGFIVTYIVHRLTDVTEDRTWDDVTHTFLISLFSWIIPVIFLIFCTCSWLHATLKIRKPPKWL